MRCTLVRLPDDRWQFLWTIHHLVVDRWSHEVLFAELRVLYDSFLRGEEARLPPARGFREYIAWLSKRPVHDAERFWRESLHGFTEPTLLAGGGARSPDAKRRTTRRSIGSAFTSMVRSKAAQWRTTPGALILSAIAIALAKRFGRDDVLVGLTVSGRPPDLEGAESIVGSFVNNVPARLRIDRSLPVSEWVRIVQRAQARSQAHEHVSLRDVRAWAEVLLPRPLFDTLVLLNLSDAPKSEAWPGAELRVVNASLDAGYPLLLAAAADDDELVFSLVHDATFESADIILSEMADALVAIAAVPGDATVGAIVPAVAARSAEPSTVRHATSGNPDGSHAASAEAVDREALLQLWRDVLGTDAVGLDDDFFGLGGSSLQAMELFVRLERLLGRTVPISMLFSAGSVRGLLDQLGRPVRHTGPLVKIRSSGTRPALVAVPGIGGNVLGLAGLARALGPAQPFFALQSPGLDGQEAPLTSIEAIAERYAEQILRDVAQPFHLLGLCWGAAVAFEMARRLHSVGRAPASLALIDPAALLRHTGSEARGAEAAFLRRRLELYWDELRGGDWQQRGKFFANKARRVAGVIAGNDARDESKAELSRFKVESANRDAIVKYCPLPYGGRATVYLSSGRDFGPGEDPRLEWLALIEPAPEVVYVKGEDSGDIISPAHVAAFAATLRGRLDAQPQLPVSR
jgi:thioesterase domain-containing protein/acyl carrier protein